METREERSHKKIDIGKEDGCVMNENLSSSANAVVEIKGPLVFQCARCMTIVGDSFSMICSHEDMNTITLSASSNIARSADVYTSKDGRDVGSTFFSFTCLSCDASLGNYYLTTPKDLDEIREKFTFSMDCIKAYQLGMAHHGKIPEPSLPKCTSQNHTDDIDSTINSSHKEVSKTVEEEIVKLQAVMIDIVERVQFLECNTAPLPQLQRRGISVSAANYHKKRRASFK
jgi:hypothetical protein